MPFFCETCDLNFSDRFSHLQHTCPNTDKVKERLALPSQEDEFRRSQKDDLKKHEKIHTDEKQFKCHQCDMSFNCLEELKEHTKTHTCKFLLQNKCKYGSSGKNHNGICPYAHLRLCIYYQASRRCKKGENCDFLHTNNRDNHLGARPVTKGYRYGNKGHGPSSDTAFLGESTILEFLDKYFHQRLQDMGNNNNFRSQGPKWMNRR